MPGVQLLGTGRGVGSAETDEGKRFPPAAAWCPGLRLWARVPGSGSCLVLCRLPWDRIAGQGPGRPPASSIGSPACGPQSDILSLELGSAFRETVLEGDPSSLFYVARALVKLEVSCLFSSSPFGALDPIPSRFPATQALVGTIPRVIGKGSAAAAVSDLLQRLRREVALAGPADSAPDGPRAEVDGLIILDRRVDLVTPMCTQLTYEGLIDEVLGIHNGTVEMDGGNPAAVAGEPPFLLLGCVRLSCWPVRKGLSIPCASRHMTGWLLVPLALLQVSRGIASPSTPLTIFSRASGWAFPSLLSSPPRRLCLSASTSTRAGLWPRGPPWLFPSPEISTRRAWPNSSHPPTLPSRKLPSALPARPANPGKP